MTKQHSWYGVSYKKKVPRRISTTQKNLVAQPLDPPHVALEGIAIPIAPMFFRYRRASRYTAPKLALAQLKGGRREGGIPAQATLWRVIALYGDIAEIVSPIAVYWATKPKKRAKNQSDIF